MIKINQSFVFLHTRTLQARATRALLSFWYNI